ncbi:unnamed protein product [Urochloa humidicola]
MEVDTTSDKSSVKSTSEKRSVMEINDDYGWDDVREVADVIRGGRRAKGNDGKSDRQREDPELVELYARNSVLESRHPMLIAAIVRRRKECLRELGIVILD